MVKGKNGSYQERLQDDITWTADKGGELDIICLLIRSIHRQSMTSEGFVWNVLNLNVIRPLIHLPVKGNMKTEGRGSRHQQEAVGQMWNVRHWTRQLTTSLQQSDGERLDGGGQKSIYSRQKGWTTKRNVWTSFGSSVKQTNYKMTFKETIHRFLMLNYSEILNSGNFVRHDNDMVK